LNIIEEQILRIIIPPAGNLIHPIHIIIDDYEIGKGTVNINYGDEFWFTRFTNLNISTTTEMLANIDLDELMSKVSNFPKMITSYDLVEETIRAVIENEISDIDILKGSDESKDFDAQKEMLNYLLISIPRICSEDDLNDNNQYLKTALGEDWRRLLPVRINPIHSLLYNILISIQDAMGRYNNSIRARSSRTG
jgi:hypothetical protein